MFFWQYNCSIANNKLLKYKSLMVKLNKQKPIDNLHKSFIKSDLPTIRIGDNVKIGVKIIEGNKERVQFYEGTVIAKKNSSINTTITVRKVLQGIGVERIFLIHSPNCFFVSINVKILSDFCL